MKIAVIGIGYVGLTTGVCLSELGNEVVCMDINVEKIKQLSNGELPIYEPGLMELIRKNLDNKRICFTSDFNYTLQYGHVIFLAVDTPSNMYGDTDLSSLQACIHDIGKQMEQYKLIIMKSTVPVGTTAKVNLLLKQLLKERCADFNFDLIYNPEFLREGSAINDFMYPDRVVLGTQDICSQEIITSIYKKFSNTGSPLLCTNYESAEMIKYASNAFLATKISFINEIADFCQFSGANVQEVAMGMGLDSRIGKEFLKVGPGFGGSCFPKDARALVKTAEEHHVNMSIVRSVIQSNKDRKNKMVEVIIGLAGQSKAKHIAVLGAAFKGNTDDVRESPAIEIISGLMEYFESIRVYDPNAIDNAKRVLPENEVLNYFTDAYLCASGAQVLVVLTEWDCFRNLDFVKLRVMMRGNVLIDLRNLLDKDLLLQTGFNYFGLSI